MILVKHPWVSKINLRTSLIETLNYTYFERCRKSFGESKNITKIHNTNFNISQFYLKDDENNKSDVTS